MLCLNGFELYSLWVPLAYWTKWRLSTLLQFSFKQNVTLAKSLIET